MPQQKVEVIQYQCIRCGHKWLGRSREKPIVCPKCHSPYWDRERKSI